MRVLGTILLALASSVAPLEARADDAFELVVHPGTSVGRLARAFVGDVYLKKTTRWPNGLLIRPVDLPAGSSTRRRFVERVLRRTIPAIRSYWQQVIFTGRGLPPVELDDDDAVLRYVRRNPGAIGYVAPGARLDGVRPVRVE